MTGDERAERPRVVGRAGDVDRRARRRSAGTRRPRRRRCPAASIAGYTYVAPGADLRRRRDRDRLVERLPAVTRHRHPHLDPAAVAVEDRPGCVDVVLEAVAGDVVDGDPLLVLDVAELLRRGVVRRLERHAAVSLHPVAAEVVAVRDVDLAVGMELRRVEERVERQHRLVDAALACRSRRSGRSCPSSSAACPASRSRRSRSPGPGCSRTASPQDLVGAEVEHVEGRVLVEEELRRADEVLGPRLHREPRLRVVRVERPRPARPRFRDPRARRHRIAAAARRRAGDDVRERDARAPGRAARSRDRRDRDHEHRRPERRERRDESLHLSSSFRPPGAGAPEHDKARLDVLRATLVVLAARGWTTREVAARLRLVTPGGVGCCLFSRTDSDPAERALVARVEEVDPAACAARSAPPRRARRERGPRPRRRSARPPARLDADQRLAAERLDVLDASRRSARAGPAPTSQSRVCSGRDADDHLGRDVDRGVERRAAARRARAARAPLRRSAADAREAHRRAADEARDERVRRPLVDGVRDRRPARARRRASSRSGRPSSSPRPGRASRRRSSCRPRAGAAGSPTRVCARSFASRFESGSSMRNTCGSRTSARPSATRCRCPPESARGLRSSSASIPSSSAVSSTRRRISAAAELADPEPEREVLPHAHLRVERVVLEDHRDVALARRDVVDDALADPDRARRQRLEPGEQPQRRRLARARRARRAP